MAGSNAWPYVFTIALLTMALVYLYFSNPNNAMAVQQMSNSPAIADTSREKDVAKRSNPEAAAVPGVDHVSLLKSLQDEIADLKQMLLGAAEADSGKAKKDNTAAAARLTLAGGVKVGVVRE